MNPSLSAGESRHAAPLLHSSTRRARAVDGYSLVELLLAAAIAGAMLTAAWSWCWSLRQTTVRANAAGEARSGVAFARRFTEAELRQAAAVVSSDDEPSSRLGIAFALPDAADGSSTVVAYRFDAGRGVVWRKAPGSYLADGVVGFAVRYYDVAGEEVAPDDTGRLSSATAAGVRRVVLSLEIIEGGERWSESWMVALRARP